MVKMYAWSSYPAGNELCRDRTELRFSVRSFGCALFCGNIEYIKKCGVYYMAVKFTSIKCPECGANLPIEEGRERIFCSYCGTPVLVTNENEKIIRHIDEAKIKRAETDRMIQLEQLELEKKRLNQEIRDADRASKLQSVLTKIWIIIVVVLFCICIGLLLFRGDDDGMPGEAAAFMFLFCIGAPIAIGGGTLVFKVLPEKTAQKRLICQGGIRFPKKLEPFNGQDFHHMRKVLQSSGFKNVECINKHDVILGIFTKADQVETVSVDGKVITSGGEIYLPDTPITITYHGK